MTLNSVFDTTSTWEIFNIRISTESKPSFTWIPSCSSHFTTNSVYPAILDNNFSTTIPPVSTTLWKDIWKLKLNDRLGLFIWKIAWDILPTKARLKFIISSLDSNTTCPLCKPGKDSLQHLFFNYVFARVVWGNSFWTLIDSTTLDFSNMLDWIKIIISPGSTLYIPKVDHHLFQIFAQLLVIFFGSIAKRFSTIISLMMLSKSRGI
jgi:hypothetical protein